MAVTALSGVAAAAGESIFYNTSMAGKGMRGSQLPPTPPQHRPQWKTGTYVEVAWGVRYNHGGGYQYRLCPSSEPLTEECFMRRPLEFANPTKHTARFADPSRDREINATLVVDGPAKGWMRLPLPNPTMLACDYAVAPGSHCWYKCPPTWPRSEQTGSPECQHRTVPHRSAYFFFAPRPHAPQLPSPWYLGTATTK